MASMQSKYVLCAEPKPRITKGLFPAPRKPAARHIQEIPKLCYTP